ncbi:MAG: hypothetical protein Q7R35_18690 [Elusimicrobiota bacterium]|nr:hypothetical protein [Elusimicrobiota bacterium]
MKKKLVIGFIALAAAGLLSVRSFASEREKVIDAFLSLHSAAAAGRSPWPGYSPVGAPLLVELPGEGGSLLFGPVKPPTGFQLLSGGGGAMSVYYSTAQFQGPDFSVLLLGGEEVTRIRFVAGMETGFRFAVHEAFHFFQWDKFKMKDTQNMPGKISAETLADAYIERQLLYNALVSEDWKSSLRSFVALRRHRYAAEKKDVREYEENRELTEGIAMYVEWKSLPYLRGKVLEDGEAIEDLQKLFNVRMPYFMFSFYGSGLAQCLILDRLGVDWKKDAQLGKPVFGILSGQVKLDERDASVEAARVRASHGFGELVEKARGEILSYERALEYLVNKHKKAARGLRVVLKNNKVAGNSSGEDGIHYIGGRTLFLPVVNRFQLAPSPQVKLALYGGSVIMDLGIGRGGNLTGELDFVVKDADKAVLKFDGKVFSQRTSCRRFVKEMSIKSPSVDFWRAGPGRVCYTGNKIEVAPE